MEYDDFYDLSEQETRQKLINPLLKKEGWLEKYIKEEINSVKSDFITKNYIEYQGSYEKGVDKFIDYLLLDDDYSPLAIIESKRFSKKPEEGRIQARTYAEDIKKQTGQIIPIFLTNGQIWKIIDEYGVERKISGPFSQQDLKRRHDLFNTHNDPSLAKINSQIVDRPKSTKIVREVSEHFSKCHRTALIEMATGTGKTRVAMAVIDILIRCNIVRNVLFIADRRALVKQAKEEGFRKFFSEPVTDLRDGFSTSGRLYVSTIQSLMENKFFQKFSPGFFDLIIFDEAHRSYYDRQNIVFDYFDAIKIGLTATPRESETQSTIDLFGEAVAQYSYDEAVNDGVLVPYYAHIIRTKVLNEGITASDLDKFQRDEVRRQGQDPDEIELTGSEFDSKFMDQETNKLIIDKFMDNCYKSDEGKPAKSIFFCSSIKHAEYMKEIFDKTYPSLSSDVQVITSNLYRTDDEIKRFKTKSSPRIALSVGILDTGVDIPEVSNLVFIKPIFSHIRFWQMLGRGTRNLQACKHREWLPGQVKKDFLIFDFVIGGHSNVEFHELHQGKLKETPDGVMTKIYKNRIGLLEKDIDDKQKELITFKIKRDIGKLDPNLFRVREKIDTILKLKDAADLSEYLDELNNEIAPLTNTIQGDNANVSSFVLRTENLFEYILDNDYEGIDKTKNIICNMVENVLKRDNLNVVNEKSDELKRVLQLEFWEDLTFDDVEFLVEEISPLMKYYVKETGDILFISAEDKIIDWETLEKEIVEDEELKRLLERSPEVRKLKNGEGVTSHELLKIEEDLSNLKPEITIDFIQKTRNMDFLVFLREIIGLSREEDPKKLIEDRFDKYIIENSQYTSRQLEFLLLLKTVFADRKHIEFRDIGRFPLGDEQPWDYFTVDELENIVNLCNEIKMC